MTKDLKAITMGDIISEYLSNIVQDLSNKCCPTNYSDKNNN